MVLRRFASQPSMLSFLDFEGIVYTSKFKRSEYTEELFQQFVGKVPSHLIKANKYRKAEFLSGYFLSKYVLNEAGCDVSEITVENRLPVWPNGYIGSISQCKDLVAVAVCETHLYLSTGLNVESVFTQEVATEMSFSVLDPLEKALLSAAGFDFPTMTSLAYSAKESLFKCLYQIKKTKSTFLDYRINYIDSEKQTIEFKSDVNTYVYEGDVLTPKGHYLIDDSRVYTLVVV